MAPGARSKFRGPMCETKVFRKQMHGIEESTCDIVRVFGIPRKIWRPHSDSAPGEWRPFCLHVVAEGVRKELGSGYSPLSMIFTIFTKLYFLRKGY